MRLQDTLKNHSLLKLFQRFTMLTALFTAIPELAQAQSFNATSTVPDTLMEQHFRTPPTDSTPWVYWMWLYADTSPEAITADLEAMHAKGIKGLILYDTGTGSRLIGAEWRMVLQGKEYRKVPSSDFPGAKLLPLPVDRLVTWESRSRELLRFASKEAGRLGIKLVLSVGLAGTSGPIEPEYGQQRLLWSQVSLTGPQEYDGFLPVPAQMVPATSLAKKAEASRPSRAGENEKFGGHEVAVLALPDKQCASLSDVINLSKHMDSDGRLHWVIPDGRWHILRFAYAPTGKKNLWGLYTDAMSAEALDRTWHATIGKVLEEMTSEERKGLFGIEDDSWESGESTWTKQFPDEFYQMRGYDLIPWLPVLAGMQMQSPETSEGVRRDYYRTIADLIAKNHYAHLRELAGKNNLIAFAEACGPNTAQLDYMKNSKGVDVAMGEFWVPSPHRPTPERRFMLRNAASANHLYGKRITACEAFTSLGPQWEDTFFDMKNSADQAFADGCNLMVIHCFSHSPSVTAKPGYVYFAGTQYNSRNTWWEQTPAFNAYLGRCSFLLQQGLFVADALYFCGDAIGNGEPMKTRPALPSEGYDHDNCNLDAILTRVTVKNGRLVLPDGMSYRILVLPDNAPMAPQALRKIAQLLNDGATIVGPRPTGMAGLPLTPETKEQFNALVMSLWGKPDVAEPNTGSGRLIVDAHPGDVLTAMHVMPDFTFTGLSDGGEIDWIHRTIGNTEIYFVASLWDPKEKIDCSFRVSGKQPELWDPVTGEIRDAVAFRQMNGRTVVPLEFNSRESVFVVFRKPIASDASGYASSNYPVITRQAELSGPWTVCFDPKWGGPEQVNFDSLTDWTKRPEDGIRYYSGTAVYRITFHLDSMPAKNEKHLLNLGQVHEIASVKLNDNSLGVIWTRPARVDITHAARTGQNVLEITVVNLWPNRLIGDSALPAESRFTETNIHKFSMATPLYPSGLIGPVTLETAGL